MCVSYLCHKTYRSVGNAVLFLILNVGRTKIVHYATVENTYYLDILMIITPSDCKDI